jgi:hypothetical protein
VSIHVHLLEHKHLNQADAPSTLPPALKATLRRVDETELVSELGLSRKKAQKHLSTILSRVTPNADRSRVSFGEPLMVWRRAYFVSLPAVSSSSLPLQSVCYWMTFGTCF